MQIKLNTTMNFVKAKCTFIMALYTLTIYMYHSINEAPKCQAYGVMVDPIVLKIIFELRQSIANYMYNLCSSKFEVSHFQRLLYAAADVC